MKYTALDVPTYYVQHGDGTPILILHGAQVDHREMVAALEPVFTEDRKYRRVYPDLPAMGRTPAPETISGADDVLDVLLAVVDGVIGEERFLVVGHSAGAYYARAIAGRRPGRVSGLALICPLDENVRELPAHQVLHSSVDPGRTLDRAESRGYRDYFVVQTPATLKRYKDKIVPAHALIDQAGMERIGANWILSSSPEKGPEFPNPTLIVTGRQDSMVGYAAQWDLLDHYPRATFAVLDRAGHALAHEQPDLLKALITEWLDRVREHDAG